ncbi:hypothetical protein WA026_017985 [Henosepilachna vigintioctopunctata]|uniref:Generative cell specific-1/HAP2 domain-containing protein n=1 Tax=Henosepilachna vigintioctopunctata TaxID=420089 RepID=A0AAW1TUZ4_9CUCU
MEHKFDDKSLDQSINIEDDISSDLTQKTKTYVEEDFNELNDFGMTSKEPPTTDAEQKYYEEEFMQKFKEHLQKKLKKHKHRKHKKKPQLKTLKKLLKQIEKKEKAKNFPFMHPRGGQDCSNRTCPPGVDPRKYHESTHCLVFSELWYTVYRLEKPAITHELSLEIFEKHEDLTGHVVWKDLTNDKPLTLGTSKTEDTDQFENIWAGYVGVDPAPHAFGIDPVVHRLLVPEHLKPCQEIKYPELRGGPREWLVIPNYMITYDGSRCDKVGVGYEAFVKQSNRCDMPRGTCLNNQPKDLWNHDRRMEEAGKPGSYFLKYYGQLPICPIQNSSNNNGQNLTFYFREPYLSSLHIELKTDYNIVLRPHAAAVITEVYVDGTNYIKSTVTVKVTNSALVYGVYFVALTDCPLDIPASFSNIKTKPALIPPQHQHIFTIEIMSSLPERKFYCSVEAKNARNELLSFRRVRFQKNDRCVCIWHCVCTCLETDGGLTCQPLPFDHYTAAGFHGGLPVAADYVQFTLFEELMTLLYHLFLTMTLILILLGVMKAAIGVYFRPIGEWGLCSMLGLPKPIKGYYEESLRDRVVIYDSCGWPIHPDTKKRVRNASMIAEICINCIFFLIYPLVMINVIVKRLCFVDSSDESIKQMCCLCGQKHESGECPSLCILKSFGFRQKSRKGSSHRRLCMDVCTQEHLSEEYDECNCD